jgi:cyclic pyranopterin phosphate synthase
VSASQFHVFNSLASAIEPSVVCPQPTVRQLRLSVTDLCNFRCRYCMPAQGVAKLTHDEILPLEAMAGLVGWLSAHAGIRRVRLTGGEPLVRSGICDLIREIKAFPSIEEVTLTTNGSLLPRLAKELKAAGVSRVNISLDSLDRQRFAEISRGADLGRVLAGIEAAREAGLTPIKLNAVLLRSSWREDVPALLDYAAQNGFEIRFIELMRTGTERAWCESEFVSVDEVRQGLKAAITAVKESSHAPAQRTLVNWRGKAMLVGWITPRSHPFCASCERLRLDARGRLHRCLMDPTTLDLPRALGSLENDAAKQEFDEYLAAKRPPALMDSSFAMSQIGG